MFTSPIITVDELHDLLDPPDPHGSRDDVRVVVCDVRAYLDGRVGRDAYEAGHVPGARFIDLETVLAAPPAPVLGRHPLPTPEVFAAGLAAEGIGPHAPVVAYDDAGGMIAGRLVWMLRTLGQSAALLDGGIAAWDGPLETGAIRPTPVEHAPRQWPAEATLDADDVQATLDRGGLVVDSRASPRFEGRHEPIDPRAGHIPGAINLPFTENLDEGRFLPVAELRERFERAGVDENTVWYCGSGVSACHNLLAAEAAGLGVGKLYTGSWSGWSSDDDRPVATG